LARWEEGGVGDDATALQWCGEQDDMSPRSRWTKQLGH
jgi:hypothetical protein